MGERVRIWPRAVQTVGAMQAGGVAVFARCPTCETSFKVNLDLLIQAHGRHSSELPIVSDIAGGYQRR